MIGSFFGKVGSLWAKAREITRPSAGEVELPERAAASRNLFRGRSSSCSRNAVAIAFKRFQLDLILIGECGGFLLVVEFGLKALDPGPGGAGIVLQRAGSALGGAPHLRFKIAELACKLLHARMAGQQRALVEGDLCLELRALLEKAADQFVVVGRGGLEDTPKPERLARISLARDCRSACWVRAVASAN